MRTSRTKWKDRGPLVAVLGVFMACAQAPHIEFVPDEAGSMSPPPTTDGGPPDAKPDATAGNVDAAPVTGDDASTGDDSAMGDDSSPFIDPGDDDAGPDAAIGCNGTVVANCAQCIGSPLRCKRTGVDECVPDCEGCGPDTLPCFHCPTAKARPRGNCLRVGSGGRVACSETNLCACSTPADCTPAEGAAQVCIVDPSASAGQCLTCGSLNTGGDPCARADGGTGQCSIVSGGPFCK